MKKTNFERKKIVLILSRDSDDPGLEKRVKYPRKVTLNYKRASGQGLYLFYSSRACLVLQIQLD